MFKKSVYIILIQIIGIILGFISVFFVAGDMNPEVYAIVGIFQNVSGLSLVFTGWGLETVLTREALYWNKKGDIDKVKEYTTQAILSKLISGILVVPLMILYLMFMNIIKYNGQYTGLFFCLAIGAISNVLIDSMRNIVRSDGGYVFVQVMSTLNTTILKSFGIILYFNFGALVYLYFYVLSSLPILIAFVIRCKNNMDFKYIQVYPMFLKIWSARYLWMKADLEYIRANVDGLLVSILFPAEIMGAYSIYKSLEQMMQNFIEGFFDVLSQHTVQYKGDVEALDNQEKKIKIARNICILAILLGIFIYIPRMDWWIRMANLSKYDGMKWLVLCVAIGGIMYLWGKYEINAILFLAESKMTFLISAINAMVAIATYLIILFYSTIEAVIMQRLINYFIASLIAIIVFRKNRNIIYSK